MFYDSAGGTLPSAALENRVRSTTERYNTILYLYCCDRVTTLLLHWFFSSNNSAIAKVSPTRPSLFSLSRTKSDGHVGQKKSTNARASCWMRCEWNNPLPMLTRHLVNHLFSGSPLVLL